MYNFKNYTSNKDSFLHYAKLLTEAKIYEKVNTSKNYEEDIQYIIEGGYATDPDYKNKVISVIEKYNLNEYDDVK